MDVSHTGGTSIFMCRLCNLFSPHHAQLLSHVSELHQSEAVRPDDIIVPLMPLSQRAAVGESPVKRKRGRPKGSTKKPGAEGAADTSSPQRQSQARGQQAPAEAQAKAGEEGAKTGEEGAKTGEEGAKTGEEGGPQIDNNDLDCKKCNRKFSNRRQILKHICLREEGEEEENDKDSESQSGTGSREEERERTSKRPRPLRSEKVSMVKDTDQSGASKNPIISVVLTAHDSLPGATKIVPIEATPSEQLPAPEPANQDGEMRRGFQEYAIQQAAYEVPLKSNRLGQTQLKIFTCEYCNKVFKFRHSLQAHLRIHTNEKPFQCPHCDYASAIKANLSVHMRKHTGERFSCHLCPFTCLSKGHLKVHVERVHDKVKQHCRFCKKKYSDVKNLLKHMRLNHDLQTPAVRDAYQEFSLQTRQGKRQLLYDCSVCDRKFKNELDRDRHMMVHGSERPFGCELCDHGATKLPALQAHVRKHPFVYVCVACQQKFVSSVRLREHLRGAHPDREEGPAFSDSINNSFCLLEPGDDIRRDMLPHDQLHITQELALLSTPGGGEEETGEGKRDGEKEEQESNRLTVDTPSQETLPDRSGNQEVISDATPDRSGNQEVISEETPDGSGSQEVISEETPDRSGNQDVISEETPDRSGNQEVISEETPDRSVDKVNKCLLPAPEGDPIEEADCGSTTSGPAAVRDGPERSAFQQIMERLQKRQLNMAVFQRIRKVYGDLECEYCGKLFWYQVHYSMHVRTHTKEHLHYCSQCSYSSITKNCLKRHQVQRHSQLLLPCSAQGCPYTTPDKYKLQTHLKTHQDQEKRSCLCPVCKHSFNTTRLTHHIRTSHPETSLSSVCEALGVRVQRKGVIGKRASKCPYCDSYFLRNGADLQQHIWAHEGVKPYKCPQCDYASRSKSNLKTHMNRHSSEKSHLCDACGKKFKSKVTLKSHRLVHSATGKQFQCSECDYMATQKPLLLRHMEQHASFKPYRCAHCHYSCNIAGPLKRHYSRKHPDQEYSNAGPGTAAAPHTVQQQGGVKCPVCEFVYGTKWEMNRHLRNKHGLKVVETDAAGVNHWEVVETLEETQYLHITEDPQGTEAAVATLQNLRFSENGVVATPEGLDPTAVNILQQIIDLGSENSVVAMAPGTLTVVEQVAEEDQRMLQEGNHGNHLVVSSGEVEGIETVTMVSSGDVEGIETVTMVSSGDVEGIETVTMVSSGDVEGIETVTVYTQGDDASQFIVYVQEAVQTECLTPPPPSPNQSPASY